MKTDTENITKKKIFTKENVQKLLSILFVILVTLQTGIIIGWFMRSGDYGRVRAEAMQLVSEVSKQEASK